MVRPDSPTSVTAGSMGLDQRRFRDVLGHLPSGVVAITGVDDDGEPAGMIVGTFTSVSLDPPLVAFFVDQGSTSFPRIRAAGVFCANILSARQESLCRVLAAKGGQKFADVAWQPAGSGAPAIDEAVAWVDCDIESVGAAGDHYLVIGRVRELGVGTPTIPLLFFQGGFGAFAPGSLAIESHGEFLDALRPLERVRDGMTDLAVELGADCIAHAIVERHIVVVAAAYSPRGGVTYPQVGFRTPLVPPWAEPFLAWAPDDMRAGWLQRLAADARAGYDVESIRANMEQIRATGWAFTVRTDHPADDRTLENLVRYGYTPAIERDLTDLIRNRSKHGDVQTLESLPAGAVRTLCAPVLDGAGHLSIMLALHNLPADLQATDVRRYLDGLLELAGSARTEE
ncbi:flavin reductase [uncultured Jatrophihabitans sp.]|uniref:flavin reductase n=1 Tax=uncultured Jatrophihabitans sp. TaxID=1610747 RepID=UPI0035CC71A4